MSEPPQCDIADLDGAEQWAERIQQNSKPLRILLVFYGAETHVSEGEKHTDRLRPVSSIVGEVDRQNAWDAAKRIT